MIRTEMFGEDGKPINDTIVPPGGKLRVPLALMDGAPLDMAAIARRTFADAEKPQAAMHRPGTIALSDADYEARETARHDRKSKLSDAWKHPPAVDTAAAAKTAPTTPTRDAADRRDARLRDAWRN